jgi:hypothetical protein
MKAKLAGKIVLKHIFSDKKKNNKNEYKNATNSLFLDEVAFFLDNYEDF